jgi:hypothetical protein
MRPDGPQSTSGRFERREISCPCRESIPGRFCLYVTEDKLYLYLKYDLINSVREIIPFIPIIIRIIM